MKLTANLPEGKNPFLSKFLFSNLVISSNVFYGRKRNSFSFETNFPLSLDENLFKAKTQVFPLVKTLSKIINFVKRIYKKSFFYMLLLVLMAPVE